MSLRDKQRAASTFGPLAVDDSVRRILADWGKERDSDLGRLHLSRAAAKLSPEHRAQLVARLAEISLGLFFVLERASESEAATQSEPEPNQ